MKRNLGTIERIIRFILGAALLLGGLLMLGGLSGNIIGIVASVVGIILIATAAISWCPIWQALGINTHKKEETK
jgi:uncharacterized membrane protein